MTKTDRDTLRSLHGRKKWEHIWAYYKLPIAIVLIVVYILGYAAYRHVTKKEDVLYLGLVNITAGSDLTEQLTTGFAEAQGLTKKQQVDLLSGLLLSESERAEEQYVYASEMKLLGAVSAQRLDVVLMDEYARDRLLADDYFLDLRTLDASFHALPGWIFRTRRLSGRQVFLAESILGWCRMHRTRSVQPLTFIICSSGDRWVSHQE